MFFSLIDFGAGLYNAPIVNEIVTYHYPHESADQQLGRANFYKSLIDTSSSVVSFLLLPCIGGLVDNVGRKKVIILSAASQTLSLLILLIAYYFQFLFLIFASIIFVFLKQGTMVACMAYMNDLSETDAERSWNFGLALVSATVGTVIGSLTFTFINNNTYYIPLLVLIVACSLNTIYVALFLHEQIPVTEKFSLRALNPFRTIRVLFRGTNYLMVLLLVYFLFNIAVQDGNTDYNYTLFRYNWTPDEAVTKTAILSGMDAMSTVVWQVLALHFLIKHMSDEVMLTVFLLAVGALQYAYGLCTKQWLWFVLTGIGGFGSIAIPLCEGVISKQVNRADQGALFGGLASIMELSDIAGDFTLENTFTWCMKDWYFSCPGTPFFVGGAILILAGTMCVILFTRWGIRKNDEYTPLPTNDEEIKNGILISDTASINS